MKRKKIVSFIAILLAVLMVLSLIIGVLPIVAGAVSQEDIDAATAARDRIQEELDAKQAVVDELEAQQAGIVEIKTAMDERNTYCREQIEQNNRIIDIYNQMIQQKSEEVDAAKALENQQLERYRARVRAMEENGDLNVLALVLNTSSLGELLTLMDDIGEIMEADRHLADDYIEAREYTESVKAEYEEYKADIESKVSALESESAELEEKIEEANRMIAEIVSQINEKSIELEQINNEWDALNDRVNNLIAKLEEQRRLEEEAAKQSAGGTGTGGGSVVTGTGNFIWPVSCTYITSCVGYRFHPVSEVWKYHSGMDVGCAYGDTIWASDGGTVTLAEYYGGYGNCVMIDHGNGYYTLYGHLSSIAVSAGQTVSQGNTIGYVGSTGVSTGPHLHFEIRSNGEALDFNNWFSGLTFAPDSGGA